MSGKRSLPSLWASRGAIVATLTGVGMVLFAVVGAWMLFAPSAVAPTTGHDDPSSESTEPPEDVAIEDEPTRETTAPRTPRATVETVPPAAAPTPTAHPAAADDPVSSDRDPVGPSPKPPAGTADPGPAPSPTDTRPGNGHDHGNGDGHGNGNGHGGGPRR